jgi:hypothetical protein
MDAPQSIAFISDVGAQTLKPLFIAGSCVTTIFLDASLVSERCLRHSGRLVANLSTTEKVLSGLILGFALIGTAGLILLSIYDTWRHPNLHDLFLLIFIAGYVLSAVFICWEYHRLGTRTCTPVPKLHTSIGTNKVFLGNRFPRTPHPPHLLLDKNLLLALRSRARNRLWRLQYQIQIRRRCHPRMVHSIRLHLLRA